MVLVGKFEGSKLGKPCCRWEHGMQTDVREIGCDSMDWIYLARNRKLWRPFVGIMRKFRTLLPLILFLTAILCSCKIIPEYF